jgi:sulfur relay (sulfurtransferase) DsrC/TusE family protein
MKCCSSCRIEKNEENFKIIKNRLDSWCKDCRNDAKRKWRIENVDKMKIYKKKWSDKNSDYQKKYYEDNKLHLLKYRKDWYLQNKDDVLAQKFDYYVRNREHILQQRKLYYNLIKFNSRYIISRREYMRKFYQKYPYSFACRNILKRTLSYIGSDKTESTKNLLGYSSLDLKIYLESLFIEGMTWENYGDWHIDHIKPLSKFSSDVPIDVINSLSNLQPLWASDNLKKSNKYE